MRPILVQIPSKLLFFVALGLAGLFLVRGLLRRRKDPRAPIGITPLYLVAGALVVLRLRSPAASLIPTSGVFALPWDPIPIYAYGVMLGLSMIGGWFLAMKFAKQDGIAPQVAATIYMWTAVWSIVGARLLYVVTNLSVFVANPLEIVKVNNGGLVAYGGMIGGFLASWYGCHKRGIPLLRWADVSAPSVVLGTAVTRVGCLLYGCDFGARSSLPWAISFPQNSPAWQRHVSLYGLAPDALRSFPVHPTQVYESLVGLTLFGLLLLLRKYRKFSGEVFLGWVMGYGLMRPLIEIVRDDDQRGEVGPLSTSQFIGLVSLLLGGALLAYLIRRYRRDPDSLRLWEKPLATAGVPEDLGGGGSALATAGAGRGAAARKRKRRRGG
jgi:prolipoprotein diacylglyceryl transferase